MSQRYAHPYALSRMADGRCPECGFEPFRHDGWGGPAGCTLTDAGVSQRVAQYRADQESARTETRP
jgi:hypothetical protein